MQTRKPVKAHSLAKVVVETGQDAERKNIHRGHPLPGEERGQEELECKKIKNTIKWYSLSRKDTCHNKVAKQASK